MKVTNDCHLCDVEKIVFYAKTNQSQVAVNAITFANIKLNYGNGFNETNSKTFTCPRTGLYWLFYTVFWDGMTFANVTVLGTNQSPILSMRRLHTVYDKYDTISRDKILNLTLHQQLTVSSSYPTVGNYTMGSSWGAFLLDHLLSSYIAFEVYKSSAQPQQSFYQAVFNYGNAWNNATQLFTAPQSGIYYFSISVGVPANTKEWNAVSLQGVYACSLEIYSMNHNGPDIISRGCLLQLTLGQSLSIAWDSSPVDISYSQTSFRGFLYSPVSGVQVAWSVHNNGIITGSGTAMSFPIIRVNVPSSVWQVSSNKAFIPVSGTYYVEMVGQTNTSPTQIDMRLTLNNSVTISRLFFASSYDYVTRSLPVIVHLQLNSLLSVAFYSVSLFGDNNDGEGLSFQGFLVYPD